jgi:2-keto-4-pentenoate hydratase
VNVGARAGILGERYKVSAIPDFVSACEKMKFVLKDGHGNVLSSVEGAAANGNPLNALLWLIEDLRKSGEKLRPGDLLSLGSPSPQVVPKAGQKFVLTYEGFPEALSATVSFTP